MTHGKYKHYWFLGAFLFVLLIFLLHIKCYKYESRMIYFVLAIPLPGPADYSPTQGLTKPSAPQYSIVGKPKPITGK